MFQLPYNWLISHTSKVMLKFLQARLQQYVNWELPDVHAGFRKGRGTRDQIANIHWIMEKAREFQKNIYNCFIDYASLTKPFSIMWITTNCGKFLKRWKIQGSILVPWEICMWVMQLDTDTEQLTGSKLGKEYNKAVYCHPAYLTYMQSTSCEMPSCMNQKLESQLPRECQQHQIGRWGWQKVKRN